MKEAESRRATSGSPPPSASWSGQIEEVLKKKLTDEDGNPLVEGQEHRFVAEQAQQFNLETLDIRSPQRKADVEKIYKASGRRSRRPSTPATGG